MTAADIVAVALRVLFGPPRAIFYARVLAAIGAMCPCQPGNDACEQHHMRAADAIVEVAWEEPDPDNAAALLVGAGAHETCYRTEREMAGGPAVSYWQVEVRRAERAALLVDPAAAARVALRAARACGGSMMAYAGGRCAGDGRVVEAAAELRRYVARARMALR